MNSSWNDETVVLLSQLRQKPDDYIDVDIDVAVNNGLKPNRAKLICCPFHNDKHPSMKVLPAFCII